VSAGDAEQQAVCPEEGCRGVPLRTQLDADDGGCLAHTKDTEAIKRALLGLTNGGELWFARGVPFTPDLLEVVQRAAPHESEDKPILRSADFRGATFQGPAHFGGRTFQAPADFRGATFQDAADFVEATFRDADFNRAISEKTRRFGPAVVRRTLDLSDAVFKLGAEIAASAETIDAQRLHLLGGGHPYARTCAGSPAGRARRC
jgi:hypothetical protein